MITVHDVCKDLGIEPSSRLMWAVGKAVAAEFESRHKIKPAMRRAPKRCGSGSHCLAHYPADWRRRIEEVILSMRAIYTPAPAPEAKPHPQIALL